NSTIPAKHFCAAFILIALVQAASAIEFVTVNSEPVTSNWTASVWYPNGGGSLSSPVAGNTYRTMANGVNIANNAGNTRVRNPNSSGVQTFPGDSLTLGPNTDLKAQNPSAILDFPG